MMHRSHQVTANAEEVADESMHGQESLCLPGRFEPAHLSLALPCGLVGDFGAIVLVSVRAMGDGRHDRSVRSPVAAQLVGDQPPRRTLLTLQQLGRCCVIRARGEPGREAHPPQHTRSDRGIPSSAIRFSTAHLIAASTFWFLTVRAERLTPSIALYRETAFSATLWRVQPLDFRHS